MKTIVVILSLLLSFNTFASGKILYVKGKAYLNGKKAKKGAKFKKGDVFKTGSNSLLVAKIDGGSTIKLIEKSKIKLTSFKQNSAQVKFTLGSAFFKIKKNMNGKKKFIVNTRGASMGIRGTEFFVSYGKGKDEWMCVNEGIVEVRAKGEKKNTRVKAGEGIVVKDGKKTSKPKPLEWTKKLNWETDPDKGSLENEVEIEEAYTDPLDEDYD